MFVANNMALTVGTSIAVLLAFCAPICTHAAEIGDKKVIEMGWDQPTDVILHRDIGKMEAVPFDGVVFGALGWEGARRIDLYKLAWGAEAFNRTQFTSAVANLKATPFHRFTDNFIRLDVTPGDVDWFDDAGWKSILNNAEIASWIANEGGVKGIFFDTEQYGNHVFYYQKLPGKDKHTFEEYQTEARKRGREYGKALTSEKQDAIIILSYSTSVLALQKQPTDLAWSDAGLLAPFIDGMLEGASEHAQFVDGLEEAYAVKNPGDFAALKRQARDASVFSMDQRLYKARMKMGFGLWLDNTSGGGFRWDPINTASNFYQPAEFQSDLHGALETSDRYVWIYSQKTNWWTGVGLSPQYITALQNAKSGP